MMRAGVHNLKSPVERLDSFILELPSGPKTLRTTVRLIGKSIRSGSIYPPLRHHAASIATQAAPKDYLGQVKALYDDFTRNRWRYVMDPAGTEAVNGDGKSSWALTWGANARRDLGQRGYGDCDDATAALGAALYAIGMPVRIATVNKPGSPTLFTHVYPEAHVKNVGWIAVDAVGFPQHGIGWDPPTDRIALWDLKGNLITKRGAFPRSFAEMFGAGSGDAPEQQPAPEIRGIDMANAEYWKDYGLENYGLAGTDGAEPEEWSQAGLVGFGAYEPTMGMMPDASHLMMEYDGDDEVDTVQGHPTGLVRTKMLEIDPKQYRRIVMYGYPQKGAVALSDDGDVYQWTPTYTGLGFGFFKKLFKGARKLIRKGIKWVKSKARALIKKLPGGKYILKLHDKIKAIAMKVVRPLAKFVGKYAAKLAPIAAMIPGYGPAIAAGLYTAGKIAKIANETGVLQDPKTGKPKFKSGKQAKAFVAKLRREAEQMKREKRRGKVAGRRMPNQDKRLLKAGTPEHQAALRGLGADVEEVYQ